ncbi:serine/threonine protein kinase-20 [Colletotrichum salicis]|uniref:Serine/threonine protein kinase-20 n=1 Tax=Colletotrichum salicis TaxID=1209931 RepID=A0A135UGL7_9PEZI|nr:serine/threonine protein kinase-20 [Colletotrichum salicis]
MSSLNSESTQAFSDSADLQRRIDQIKAEYRENSQLAGQSETCTATSATTLPTPGSLELTEIIEAFSNASLASLPDARLIFACRRQPRNTDSAMIPLPHKVGGWNMIGVIQRTHDVNFTLCVPLNDPPCDPRPTRFIPLQVRCSVYYDPADDSCVLVNKSCVDFYLTSLCSPTSRRRLSYDQTEVIKPGMWRISAEVKNLTTEQHLVDFLMQRRQFTITLLEGLPSYSATAKRLASGEEQHDAKRRRRERAVAEVVLATATDLPHKSTDAAVTEAAKGLGPAISTSQKIARAGGTPLLDLSDGGVAVVRSKQVKDDEVSYLPLDREAGGISRCGNQTTYRLHRLKRIADTLSASLFTGRHSALSEKVVAKVIRYKGKTAEDLIKCASIWKREKSFLEKLHHPNIISLKAFDGRVFAMLVEQLPPSLHRGFSSPFKISDAQRILQGTSSALAYLADQRVIHNDIKPANIAYSPERGAVLLDFGLATTINEKELPGGTPWYVPPDLIVQRTRGAPGDVWALGVTMLYVLGNITLPEKTTKGWLIRNVTNRHGEARERLLGWLDNIARARVKLDRTDVVENTVFRMLEPGIDSRIHATQIAAWLEDLKATLGSKPHLSNLQQHSIRDEEKPSEKGDRTKRKARRTTSD